MVKRALNMHTHSASIASSCHVNSRRGARGLWGRQQNRPIHCLKAADNTVIFSSLSGLLRCQMIDKLACHRGGHETTQGMAGLLDAKKPGRQHCLRRCLPCHLASSLLKPCCFMLVILLVTPEKPSVQRTQPYAWNPLLKDCPRQKDERGFREEPVACL